MTVCGCVFRGRRRCGRRSPSAGRRSRRRSAHPGIAYRIVTALAGCVSVKATYWPGASCTACRPEASRGQRVGVVSNARTVPFVSAFSASCSTMPSGPRDRRRVPGQSRPPSGVGILSSRRARDPGCGARERSQRGRRDQQRSLAESRGAHQRPSFHIDLQRIILYLRCFHHFLQIGAYVCNASCRRMSRRPQYVSSACGVARDQNHRQPAATCPCGPCPACRGRGRDPWRAWPSACPVRAGRAARSPSRGAVAQRHADRARRA